LDFSSSTAGKYQGFVNIKTNFENLILHVEVVVVKGGIHRTPEELDFGTITSMHERRSLELSLLNGGASAIQISDLQAATADSQLVVDFSPLNISPKSESVVASVSFSAVSSGSIGTGTSSPTLNSNSKNGASQGASQQAGGAQQQQQQSNAAPGGEYRNGKLLLRTHDSNPVNARMEIPYRVRVLQGGLGYQPSNTTFPATIRGTNTTRDLVLTSKFNIPLLIYSAEIEHPSFELISDKIPQVGNSTAARSVIVEPGAALPTLRIVYVNPQLSSESSEATTTIFSTLLTLNTNASALSIPLVVYAGALDVLAPRGGETDSLAFTASADQMDNLRLTGIDFGVVGLDELKMKTLNITNRNPVPVTIQSITATVDGLALKLEGIWNNFGYMSHTGRDLGKLSDGKKSPASKKASSATGSSVFSLDPGHSAILSLELSAKEEKSANGLLKISTPYESLSVKVIYQALGGALDVWPLTVHFDEAAAAQKHTLTIQNGFSRPVGITSIEISDSRLQAALVTSKPIRPSDSVDAIHVTLSSSTATISGPSQNWPELNEFLSEQSSVAPKHASADLTTEDILGSPAADSSTADMYSMHPVLTSLPSRPASEIARLLKLAESWRSFPNGLSEIRTTLVVKTDIAVVSRFPLSLVWPFPTLLGKDISVKRFGFGAEAPLKEERSFYISVENPLKDLSILGQLVVSSDDAVPGVSLAKLPESAQFVLLPGEKLDIGPIVIDPVAIQSTEHYQKDVVVLPLYIRNNLTVLETVQLEFRLAKASLVLSSSADESHQLPSGAAVQFVLNSTQLELSGCCCSSTSSTWKLLNRGNVPIVVDRVGIDGAAGTASASLALLWNALFNPVRSPFSSLKCEGFGFTVTSPLCRTARYRLEPFESVAINMTYSPDFSAARISRDFIVETVAFGSFRFELEATLPEESVLTCLDTLAAEQDAAGSEESNIKRSVVGSNSGVGMTVPSTTPPPFLADYLFQGYPGSVAMRPVVVILAVLALFLLMFVAFRDYAASGENSALIGEECILPFNTTSIPEPISSTPQNGAAEPVKKAKEDPVAPQVVEPIDKKPKEAPKSEVAKPASMLTPTDTAPVSSQPTISKKQQKKAARAAAAAASLPVVPAAPIPDSTSPTVPVAVIASEPVSKPEKMKTPAPPAPSAPAPAPLEAPKPPATKPTVEKKPQKERNISIDKVDVEPKPEKTESKIPDSKADREPKPLAKDRPVAPVKLVAEEKKDDKKNTSQSTKVTANQVGATVSAPAPLPAPAVPKSDVKIMKREVPKEQVKEPTPTPAPSAPAPVSILKKETKPIKEPVALVKTPPSPTKATAHAGASKAPSAKAPRPGKETTLVEPITLLKKPQAPAVPTPTTQPKQAWATAQTAPGLKYVAVDPEKKKQRMQQPSTSSSSSGGSSPNSSSPPVSANSSQIYSNQTAGAADPDPAALVEQLYMLHQQHQEQASAASPDLASMAATAAELASALQQLDAINQRNHADGPPMSTSRGRGRGAFANRGSDRGRRGYHHGHYNQQPQVIYKRKVPPSETGSASSSQTPQGRGKGASWPSLPQLESATVTPGPVHTQHFSNPASTSGSNSGFSEFYAPSPYSGTPAPTQLVHPDADSTSGLYGLDDFTASLYNPYGALPNQSMNPTLSALLAGPPRSSTNMGPVGIIGSGIPAASRVAAIWERLPGVNSNPSVALTPGTAIPHMTGPLPMTPAIGSHLEPEDDEYFDDDAELESVVPGAFVDDDDYYYPPTSVGPPVPAASTPAPAPSVPVPAASAYSLYQTDLPSPSQSPRTGDSFSSLFSSLPFFSGKPFFSPLFSTNEPTQSESRVSGANQSSPGPNGLTESDGEESSLFSGSNFIPPTMAVSAAAIRRASIGSASSRPRSADSSFSDLDNAVDDSASSGSNDD
jgi:hypothetical protein